MNYNDFLPADQRLIERASDSGLLWMVVTVSTTYGVKMCMVECVCATEADALALAPHHNGGCVVDATTLIDEMVVA